MNGQASSQLVHTYERTPNLNLAPVPGPSNAYQPDLLLLQVKRSLKLRKMSREPTNVVDETPDSRQEHLLHNDHDEDLDISALFNNNVHDETWTKQEIKEMLGCLKERGMGHFVRMYAINRAIPIPKLLLVFGINLCPELQNRSNPTLYYFLRVAMWKELRLREKLPQYNTISDAVELIRNSKRMLILTGAGISVSCGIPDFRSRNGLYAQLGGYEFDINYFRENPSVFYSFASQIYPSNFVPSPCHRFIKLVEDKGQLLRNYTQNIDTLETVAGVKQVLQCHGSFATASCLLCRRRVPGNEIESEIMRRKVPLCPVCNPPNPPSSAQKNGKKQSKKKAKGEWDSDCEDESDAPTYPPGIMKVAPVADILSHLPHSVPQILINKTPIRHINPDIVLLGNADDIVVQLCAELEWDLPPPTLPASPPPSTGRLQPPRGNLKKRPSSGMEEEGEECPQEPRRVGNRRVNRFLVFLFFTDWAVVRSHVWLFSGAEGGKWLSDFEKQLGIHVQSSQSSSATQTRASSPGTTDLGRDVKKARVS
ncbi:DHS-like NAD/FAD-binding domain-containing protein [Gymnopus androsaceus JB14]|uniref:DHS-like NAD/FAD-binding domain-containing protein n=1 Tax=Gymnopus androsaceus JB14 TaxID=1447944 RepID=A0A6A4I8I1_9AGAR|nr:DHS-like NAD/FAD-binding domain-containing protein [Gymnopus androsaceus JB14]